MKEITLLAVVENIPSVTAFIDGELEKAGCSPKAQMQIDIAIDELFSNIAHYAYAPLKGPATVRFDLDKETGVASVTFLDRGVPYNPLRHQDPDVTLSAENRAIGGLGIFMVRKSMDEICYEYRDGFNMLTIRKKMN